MLDPLRLQTLLQDTRWYSLSTAHVCTTLQCTRKELLQYCNQPHKDRINIFIFDGVEYIGLESRRITYDLDAFCGRNWVETQLATRSR